MSAEVRSRLVSQVAAALHTGVGDDTSCEACDARAEVAVRTVCDLLADELKAHDIGPNPEGKCAAAWARGAEQMLDEAAALVRSLGQP